MRRSGGPTGRPSFAQRREQPQAEKVDSLRDALYPKRTFFDVDGLPRAGGPWTAAEVTRIVEAKLEPAQATQRDVMQRLLTQTRDTAGSKPHPITLQAYPKELLATGKIRATRGRRMPKPVRRGGVVISIPTAAETRQVGRKSGRDGDAAAPRKPGDDDDDAMTQSAASDDGDDVLSGMGASDDDGDDGGSGDELTL